MQDVDMVFHAAAFVAVERVDEVLMERINVGGTRAMCEAALNASVRRLSTSPASTLSVKYPQIGR
jgi:nucleoside-diphosphate-sugar epimerase